jgi:endonuclease/exonuclease/phosphatase family metal-dependent hydrolase
MCVVVMPSAAGTAWAGDLVPISGAAAATAAPWSPSLVPIDASAVGRGSMPPSGVIPLASSASLPGPAPVASGLPPLRPITMPTLPHPISPERVSAARHDPGALAPQQPLATIRSIPLPPVEPSRTAGLAALGLAPIQPGQPLRSLPVVEQPRMPPATPQPPIAAAATAVTSLPVPRPVSYAPLPIPAQPSLMQPAASAPQVAAAPLPPPLPVATLPPPLPVASQPVAPLPVGPLPVAAVPLPVPAAAPAAALPPALPSSAPMASAPMASAPMASAPMASAPMAAAPMAAAAGSPTSAGPLAPAAASAPASPAVSGPGKPTDSVMIASFNIQVFGESKLAKPQVVDVLTKVVRQFDIVAVQEVRAKSDSVVPTFVSKINADGSRYQFVIGPRLGRTVSKEQYTFIYDSNRIELDPSSVGTLPNPGDKFHRPPLRARFRVRTNPPEAGFSFWLVDIHTDPDEVPQEVDALADAFVSMRSFRPDEDDVIVLGDLNAGPPQFGRIKQIPGIGWAVSGVTTNTRRSKTYDNLIFDRTVTTEYTGRWGVLDLQDTFHIPLDKALEVSDHNPVWAAFSPWEARQMAGQTAPPR